MIKEDLLNKDQCRVQCGYDTTCVAYEMAPKCVLYKKDRNLSGDNGSGNCYVKVDTKNENFLKSFGKCKKGGEALSTQ